MADFPPAGSPCLRSGDCSSLLERSTAGLLAPELSLKSWQVQELRLGCQQLMAEASREERAKGKQLPAPNARQRSRSRLFLPAGRFLQLVKRLGLLSLARNRNRLREKPNRRKGFAAYMPRNGFRDRRVLAKVDQVGIRGPVTQNQCPPCSVGAIRRRRVGCHAVHEYGRAGRARRRYRFGFVSRLG